MVCLKRWHDGRILWYLATKMKNSKTAFIYRFLSTAGCGSAFLTGLLQRACSYLPSTTIHPGWESQQGKIHFALASNQVPKSTLYTWQPIKTQQSLWNRKTNITDILWISKIIYREVKNSRCSRWRAGRALGWWLNLGSLDVQVHIPLLYVFQ